MASELDEGVHCAGVLGLVRRSGSFMVPYRAATSVASFCRHLLSVCVIS